MPRLLAIGVASLLAISVVAAAPSAPGSAAATGYQPLPAPQRLVDTRAGERTADGEFAGIGIREARSTLQLTVAGRAGLSDQPGTVVLNLTVDRPTDPGFLTVSPCDAPRPTASNLNYAPNQTVAVAALSRVAPDGTVCIYTLAATHLIVDVAGAFPEGSFDPLAAPERLVDTREGERTVDGEFAGDGIRPADRTTAIRIAGRGSVPAAATAVALNVTATNVSDAGFLTVYPCDATRPLASNVNYEPGLTTPNLVLTRLDPDGDVCVYTLRSVDLVIDIAGSFPTATTSSTPAFEPLPEPRRLLDSRTGETTYDGSFRGGGVQQDGATLQLPVAGRADIPPDATAAVLNVTSTGSTEPGFVTAHPQGSPLPAASNVNFVGSRTVANLVIAGIGASGDVCLFTRGATHLVVDVAGWLTGPPPASIADPCPARRAPETAETYRVTYVRRPATHRIVGHDRVAVYVCDIPADSTGFDGTQQHDVTPQDVADFANAEAAPYFATASRGVYTIEFVANGTIRAARTDGSDECIEHAIDRTGAGFTNVIVADSTFTGGGFASPGTIFASDAARDFSVFERTPVQARRGGWIGGAAVSVRPNAGTIVHEIGHTVHWPHSYVGPGDEYDNPVDVMSDGLGRCRSGTMLYPCDPGNTLGFNRFAAGWLRDRQVIAHPAGTANYMLDEPEASGLQLVVAPAPDRPQSVLTLEARPAVGNDDFIEAEGVAVHVIDQTPVAGGISGLSTARRTRQARGAGGSYGHLLTVGETAAIHGLTITVFRRVGDGFEIRVAGSYRPPAPAYFAESTFDEAPTCATFGSERAVAAGCVR